jgi:DNA polymerase kappa
LDEANLDVTDYLKENQLDDDVGKIYLASKIRREICEATGMTASCGIAPNKMLAKICSEINKPDGQTILEFNETAVSEFMSRLPIRKIPGVGKVNEQILSGMGIKLCPDIRDRAMDISINFTNNAFDFLVRSSFGIAKNYHEDMGIKKSINCSETVNLISEWG